MKAIPIITAIAVSLTLAMPVAAHHLCNAGDRLCPEEIGDYMDNHEEAVSDMYEMLLETDPMGTNTRTSADPSNSASEMGEWDETFGAGPAQIGDD